MIERGKERISFSRVCYFILSSIRINQSSTNFRKALHSYLLTQMILPDWRSLLLFFSFLFLFSCCSGILCGRISHDRRFCKRPQLNEYLPAVDGNNPLPHRPSIDHDMIIIAMMIPSSSFLDFIGYWSLMGHRHSFLLLLLLLTALL